MKATVCFPWRAQPDRIAAHDRCKAYWEKAGFRVVEADSDPTKPFVCNEARNNAARLADTDILIIADADTLPDHIDQITAAIKLIEDDHADIVWPFTLYRYIPNGWEGDFSEAAIVGETYLSPGGIVVAGSNSFWRIGGYDPRFIPGASGFDDTAFLKAAETLSRVTRIYGTVWSWDHPMSVERKYDEDNPNYPRFRLYEYAEGDQELMTEVIRR